jgi:hypothetical protein
MFFLHYLTCSFDGFTYEYCLQHRRVVSDSAERDAFVRALMKFILRVRDSLRKHCRDCMDRNPTQLSRSALLASTMGPSLAFMEWFVQYLPNHLYPDAPVERLQTALQVYIMAVDMWMAHLPEHSHTRPNTGKKASKPTEPAATAAAAALANVVASGDRFVSTSPHHDPYLLPKLSWMQPQTTTVLLSMMQHSWAQMRDLAAKLLEKLHSLFSTRDDNATSVSGVGVALEHVPTWFRGVLLASQSPRLYVSQASAARARALFQVQVYQRGWSWSWHAPLLAASMGSTASSSLASSSSPCASASDKTSELACGALSSGKGDTATAVSAIPTTTSVPQAVLCFFRELSMTLQTAVVAHQEHQRECHTIDTIGDASHAVTSLFASRVRVHGVLTILRVCVEAVPTWATLFLHAPSEWNAVWCSLVTSIHWLVQLALRVHTARELRGCDLIQDIGEQDRDPDGSDEEGEDEEEFDALDSGTTVYSDAIVRRYIMNSAFLCLKEGCFSMAALVACLPLQHTGGLSLDHINILGQVCSDVLLQSRHVGAIRTGHVALSRIARCLWSSALPPVMALVHSWIDRMMLHVDGATAESAQVSTWIRRSAGLPFLCLSLLQAEGGQPVSALLPPIMVKLLQWARPDTTPVSVSISVERGDHDSLAANPVAVWRRRVHSLNLLHAIFRDASIGNHLAAFIVDGFAVALAGCAHSDFAIRNSSMMIFREVSLRLLPSINSKAPSLTVANLFYSYPGLAPLFLHICTQATTTSSATGHVPPALYPCLLIFSLLQPSVHSSVPVGDSDARSSHGSTESHLAAFLPILQWCGQHASFLTRHMAARALDALVATDIVPQFMIGLCQQLMAPQRSHTSSSHNAVQGALLQLLYLMQGIPHRFAHVATLPFTPTPSEPARTLLSMLHELQLLLLGSPQELPATGGISSGWGAAACFPVREVYLKVIHAFCGIVFCTADASLIHAVAQQAWALALENLDVGSTDSHPIPIAGCLLVGRLALRDIALKVALRCLFASSLTSDADPTPFLCRVLQDEDTPVVIGLLEFVEGLWHAPASVLPLTPAIAAHAPSMQLRTVDMQCWGDAIVSWLLTHCVLPLPSQSAGCAASSISQTNPSVTSYMDVVMVTACTWAFKSLYSMRYVFTAPPTVREALQALALACAESTRDVMLANAALAYAGMFFQSSVEFGSAEDRLSTVTLWMAAVERAADDEQPLANRAAACRSLQVSQWCALPVSPVAAVAHLQCRAWLVVMQRLQDDDTGIRGQAAEYASQCLAVHLGVELGIESTAKSLRRVFSFLARAFAAEHAGFSAHCRAFLCQLAFHASTLTVPMHPLHPHPSRSMTRLTAVLADEASSRHASSFFVGERANSFMEPLLLVQLMAKAVRESTPTAPHPQLPPDETVFWRQSLHALIPALSQLASKAESIDPLLFLQANTTLLVCSLMHSGSTPWVDPHHITGTFCLRGARGTEFASGSAAARSDHVNANAVTNALTN